MDTTRKTTPPADPTEGGRRRDPRQVRRAVTAGTLGLLLLTGTGGTFAKWSVEKAVAETGTIAAGKLDLTLSDGTWTQNGHPIDITTYRIVPGDVLTYSAAATPTIVGDNLTAHLSVSLPTSLGDLSKHLALSALTVNGEAADKVQLSPGANPLRIAFTITFEGVDGTTGMSETANLSDIKVSLNQD